MSRLGQSVHIKGEAGGGGGGAGGGLSAKVHLSSTQMISGSAQILVDEVEWDDAGFWDAANNQFVIPAGMDGRYRIGFFAWGAFADLPYNRYGEGEEIYELAAGDNIQLFYQLAAGESLFQLSGSTDALGDIRTGDYLGAPVDIEYARFWIERTGGGQATGAKRSADGNQDWAYGNVKVLLPTTDFEVGGDFTTARPHAITIPAGFGNGRYWRVETRAYVPGETVAQGLVVAAIKNSASANPAGGIAEAHAWVDEYWPGDIVAGGSEVILLDEEDYLELWAYGNGSSERYFDVTTSLTVTLLA
jgi:hypothetical protein